MCQLCYRLHARKSQSRVLTSVMLFHLLLISATCLSLSDAIYQRFESCDLDTFCFQISSTNYSYDQMLPDRDVLLAFQIKERQNKSHSWKLFLADVFIAHPQREVEVRISFKTDDLHQSYLNLIITRTLAKINVGVLVSDPLYLSSIFIVNTTQLDNTHVVFTTTKVFDQLVRLEERQKISVLMRSPVITDILVTTEDFVKLFDRVVESKECYFHTSIRCLMLVVISAIVFVLVYKRNVSNCRQLQPE